MGSARRERNIGSFTVSDTFMRGAKLEAMLALFKDVVPLHMESNIAKDEVLFYALSPHFKAVQEGCVATPYIPVMSFDESGVASVFWRPEYEEVEPVPLSERLPNLDSIMVAVERVIDRHSEAVRNAPVFSRAAFIAALDWEMPLNPDELVMRDSIENFLGAKQLDRVVNFLILDAPKDSFDRSLAFKGNNNQQAIIPIYPIPRRKNYTLERVCNAVMTRSWRLAPLHERYSNPLARQANFGLQRSGMMGRDMLGREVSGGNWV